MGPDERPNTGRRRGRPRSRIMPTWNCGGSPALPEKHRFVSQLAVKLSEATYGIGAPAEDVKGTSSPVIVGPPWAPFGPADGDMRPMPWLA